jgi:PTH1 family peptidyl-tRNA hydrolase
VLDRVKLAVEAVLTKGVSAAMNEFNRKAEEPSSEEPKGK